MDTSTTTFCKFSPLRTPDMKTKIGKKLGSPKKDFCSDSDSISSAVTRDVHNIAKSVGSRLLEHSEFSAMSSDDDIFMSQSKKVYNPKRKTKRHLSNSDSDSPTNLLVEAVRRTDLETEDFVFVSPKKIRKLESDKTTKSSKIKSKLSLKSSVKSSPKVAGKSSPKVAGKSSPEVSERQNKDHEISDNDSDFAEVPSLVSPKERKNSASRVSNVSSSSTDSPKGRNKGKKASGELTNSKKKRKERKRSISSAGDISSSEADSDSESNRKGKKDSQSGKNKDGSEVSDSDFDTRQPKKNRKPKEVSVVEEQHSEDQTGNKFKYEVPESFEIESSQQYVSPADLQGKQLWMIETPDDFDISTLHRQKIDLADSSFITGKSDEKEKQYEVVPRPCTSQMAGYNSLTQESPGSEELAFGPEIHGRIQILDWIPAMPPVELDKLPAAKHRVPDHLKPTFKPFGSESPERVHSDDESLLVPKTEKHKKKKKKKDKKKEK